MADKQQPEAPNMQPQASFPPVDPRLLAAMYGIGQDDEIDLLEYWGIIRKQWKIIAGAMLAAAIISAGISLLMPNVYEAQVLLLPVANQEGSAGKDGGLSMISGSSGGLRGLASLAGLNLGNTNRSARQNLAVLKSRSFLWDFIKDNKLMPILYADDWNIAKKDWKEEDPRDQPSLWDAYRMFTKKVLFVSTDKKSGLVTLSVDWTDPIQAADWANMLVARLNNYLEQQAITLSKANLKYLNEALQKTAVANVRTALYVLIAQEQERIAMIANTQKQYAFKVLDAAYPPDKKVKPSRALIVILTSFVASFLVIVYIFIHDIICRRRLGEETDI